MVLLIIYDIKDKAKDITALTNTIKTAGTWWHHIGNAWMIDTVEGPDIWYEKIKPYLTPQDHLIIFQLQLNYYGQLPQEAWDWIYHSPREFTDAEIDSILEAK